MPPACCADARPTLPIQGRGGYGNIEEYFATVITNIYLSDKGETALRGLYGNDEIHRR